MSDGRPPFPADGRCPECRVPLRLYELASHLEEYILDIDDDGCVIAVCSRSEVGDTDDEWCDCPDGCGFLCDPPEPTNTFYE